MIYGVSFMILWCFVSFFFMILWCGVVYIMDCVIKKFIRLRNSELLKCLSFSLCNWEPLLEFEKTFLLVNP